MTRHGGGSVFFLTDYGHADEFAGVVRAVVQRCAPGAPVVDLTHDVPPFDVRAGALTLVRAVPHLGPGVVLAVVDPGVGTARRAVAVAPAGPDPSTGPAAFVGPDNGLLPWAVDALGGVAAAVELPAGARSPNATGGATFDGRDLLAPAAARLWRGAGLHELGPAVDPGSLVRLVSPRLSVAPGTVETEVQWIDRFGNVQLSARPADAEAAGLEGTFEVMVGDGAWTVPSVAAFGRLEPGAVGMVVDANGHLALVCDRRSAATVLRVQPGDLVRVGAAGGGGGGAEP